MIKWGFFDLGWTLVDETLVRRARWDTARDMLSTCGVHLSTDELMSLSEQAATTFAGSPFRAVLNGLNMTDEQRQSIISKARYSHDQEVLYPGVPALLSELSRSHRLGVIANQSRGTADRLKAWGIHELFSLVSIQLQNCRKH
ncbi:MAG: HAD hydrolase-like protein [bacterium]